MRLTLIGLFITALFFSCQTEQDNSQYIEGIEQWKKNRLASLTRADGWTTLIGLYWLEEGEQSFGASEDNDIVFPKKAPSHIGTINLTGDSLSIQINDTLDVLIDGEEKKIARLKSDLEENTTFLTWQSFKWYIINREGKYGIRLKDSLAEARLNLKDIPHYPIDEDWKIKASLIPPAPDASIEIENIIGQISDTPLEGYLEFYYNNKSYRLAAIDGGPDYYFVIIGDETSGEDTYGGGRYLYVDRADSTGTTFIDFNKAYNPPCVFSIHATCPLPPKENFLPFEVLAGEKETGHH